MSFAHYSLAAFGSLFVAIPIVLHLLMKQRVRRYVFPALQFVRPRHSTNQRRMQLRHLALLTSRCLAIAALAAAFARPFVPSAHLANGLLLGLMGLAACGTCSLAVISFARGQSLPIRMGITILAAVLTASTAGLGWKLFAAPQSLNIGSPHDPVAAVLMFDVSPRMAYIHKNQSRLDQAKGIGLDLLGDVPRDSNIAVVHTASDQFTFSVDRSSAKRTIEGLEIAYQVRPLPELIESAMDLLLSSGQTRKEIFILTDLTESAWKAQRTVSFVEQLDSDESVYIYLLDVGEQAPINVAASDLRLSASYLAEGQPLRVDLTADATGTSTKQQIELYIEKPDPSRPIIVDGAPLLPEATLRDRKLLEVDEGGSADVSFTVRGLPIGLHHGYVRFASSDALKVDNRRYFSVEVTRAWPVLICASESAMTDLAAALSSAAFRPEIIPINKLGNVDLSEYGAVALLDPPALAPATWKTLGRYVSEGGGLGIFLGREAKPVAALNTGEAQRVLPGKLSRQWRAGSTPLVVRLESAPHPVTDTLRTYNDSILWTDFPVFRHWVFDPRDTSAVVLARFSNGHPLLLESTLGTGRVVVMTTPISDPLNRSNHPEWNRIPTGPDPWPYFVLVNDLFGHLVQTNGAPLNYRIGDSVVVATDSLGITPRLQVFHPGIAWQEFSASGDTLTYPFADVPGTYHVRNAKKRELQRGFSVNVPRAATQMTRIHPPFLDAMFGTDNFAIVHDQHDVQRQISKVRRGRDFYPWILTMFAIVLGLEFVLANRFYPVAQSGETA